LFANSSDVNLRRIKLPMTVPKGCAIDWIMLAFSGDLVYLMDRLSKEMSWIARNNSEVMRRRAMREAKVTSVKYELTRRIIEQID
jgi:hypothetical protein